MADKQEKDNAAEGVSLEDRSAELLHRATEFFKRNQTATYAVMGLLVAGAVLWLVRGNMVRKATEAARGEMGQAYVRLDQGKYDSAAVFLEKVAKGNAGLESSKAALILGGIRLGQGQVEKAEASYRIALDKSQGLPLLWAGAKRGLAVCAMNRKQFKEADEHLAQVLSKFQRVTGNAEKRGLDQDGKDGVPFLSQVMWQQVLIREAQGDLKAAGEKAKLLVSYYPAEEEAKDAQRFLALNGL